MGQKLIDVFDPVSLEGLDAVALMKRTDTKYVFPYQVLDSVLPDMAKYYNVLEVDGIRGINYNTVYFDTEDFKLYRLHQNGKLNRYKIRKRQYEESDLNFLEIKLKNNKKKTIKKRTKLKTISKKLGQEDADFINKVSGIDSDTLTPSLMLHFKRFTFAHKNIKERLTIDTGLRFSNDQNEKSMGHIVIAELKQEHFNSQSPFVRIMKQYHIFPLRISKYCLGAALLNPHLKMNRIKVKLHMINKLIRNVA